MRGRSMRAVALIDRGAYHPCRPNGLPSSSSAAASASFVSFALPGLRLSSTQRIYLRSISHTRDSRVDGQARG